VSSSPALEVRPVATPRDLSAFIDYPYRLHRRDPLWAPPLQRDVRTLLSRSKNPFFEHGEAEYYLARRGDRIVGRIAAISNRLHNETHGDRVGFFGFFECEDDSAVAGALLDRAGAWVREQGHDTLRGPCSFSVNDECGLLVEGFDTPPTLMMPHNPRYYPALVEGAGFEKAKDLLMYQIGDPDGQRVTPLQERLARGIELIKKRYDIRVRPLRLKDFPNEVERVKRLYNLAWERNWGFVPMTEHEIDHLAEQFRPVVVPDFVPFVEHRGEVVAFALAMPDLNEVFRTNRSGGLFPVVLKLLWYLKRRRFRRFRILLLGILPEFRNRGIDAVLYHWLWTKGLEHGIRWGEAGWILEDNPGMNAGVVKMGFDQYKTYRLYDRTV